MKFLSTFTLTLLLLLSISGAAVAQHRKLTIVLLRHAEKDLSGDVDAADPELSAQGRARAERLVKAVRKYNPDIIYSTDFRRTKATVLPLAVRNRAMIFIYDPRKLSEISESALSGKYKRVLIVGHNTTTPALVNLLTGQDKYKTLAETEYDKIFVVKIKKKKAELNAVKEKIVTY